MVGREFCETCCSIWGLATMSAHAFPPAALWQAYTQEVLAWQGMEDHLTKKPCACYCAQELARHAERSLKNGLRNASSLYIILGAEYEAVQHFEHLLRAHASHASLLILESRVSQAHDFLQAYGTLPEHMHLLVDSSPWALFLLTRGLGCEPEKCTLFFCTPPKARCRILEKWRKLFLGTHIYPAPCQDLASELLPAPSLSVAAIMHPQEAHVEDFFAHIPSWVHEVVVVWDADAMPALPPLPCAVPVHHYYRPLQGHFGKQRNAMLSHCKGQWVLYLDADERLNPHTWQALPALMQRKQVGGVLFPRLTFEGDAKHARMGHGLWPDVQLRLFPRTEQVHFIHSVHEQLLGLHGSMLLAPQHAILHYSHIRKSPEELRQRLAVFNAAGAVQHQLSAAYPHLPTTFFTHVQKYLSQGAVLHLPV